MADDAARFLIESESAIFPVEPKGDETIMKLKDLIKEKGKNGVLHSVDAKDLVLWKVRMSMASSNATDPPTVRLMVLSVLMVKEPSRHSMALVWTTGARTRPRRAV
jgi:hypothetical protein